MSTKVTLIIGNSGIAEKVAVEAKNKGHDVVLGLIGPTQISTEYTPIDANDYMSFVDLFQHAVKNHDKIDNFIFAFTPTPAPTTSIAEAPDEILQPLMRCVKLAWHHFRRFRSGNEPEPRKMVLLGEKGHDRASSTIHNSVLGFYRSITARTEMLGVRSELVVTDPQDEANLQPTMDALLGPPASIPTVHIISEGQTTSQYEQVGQCRSLSIMSLGNRLIPLLGLGELITLLSIKTKPLFSSSEGPNKVQAAILRFVPSAICAGCAITSYYKGRPILAFVFGLVASRVSSVGGIALAAFTVRAVQETVLKA